MKEQTFHYLGFDPAAADSALFDFDPRRQAFLPSCALVMQTNGPKRDA
jgi:hypothetical protein